MTKQINIEPNALQLILDEMRSEGLRRASTIDILRRYQGGYFKNSGISASQSFNAKFGKALQRQAKNIGIREDEAGQSNIDDRGERTTCFIWVL